MWKLRYTLLFLPLLCLLINLFTNLSVGADNFSATEFINGSHTLISSGQKFVLGFFTPPGSSFHYLGIWYQKFPQIIVWVANRENPLVISTGRLIFSKDGNLSLLNQTGNVVWHSNSSGIVKNPVAKLLDTGNLVLMEDGNGNSKEYKWQSFDYPSDTLLPGMKLGLSLKTGFNRMLTSWKNSSDPSLGDFTYRVIPNGLPQLVLYRGSTKGFRSGPWLGSRFSGGGILSPNPVYSPNFVDNPDEVYYEFDAMNSIPSRFVLDQTGFVQQLFWDESQGNWNVIYRVQGDRCNNYGLCGDFGSCYFDDTAHCVCLSGFEPRIPRDWNMYNWLSGCVRKDTRICGNGEGFKKLTDVKLPDASDANVIRNVQGCEKECLKNCSCIAYAILDNGNGCITWSGNLTDIRKIAPYGQDLYIRVAASELGSSVHKRHILVVALLIAAALAFLALISCYVISKVRRVGAHMPEHRDIHTGIQTQENDLERPLFDIATIETATSYFSMSKKIGEGGFGPVYKGELPSGQEIAVKRLAESSGQGLQEFKNEVLLMSQLQHRNLVKLLGCCVHREERMLIYEYMPNKSLDHFLFDEARRSSLTWQKRVDIIVGIARGLLYLHRDSRLRIIHRDLKASNILLDSQLNPKISDFGMARIFGADQTESKTKRVVGTYGYMSPEYAIDGYFSLKSDVFSFGVVVLEIVSGKKNRGFFHQEHQLNLLGHAWKLWNDGKALELMDSSLEKQFTDSEALRCIQVGLLCAQQRPEERPSMPSVLSMLDGENVQLLQPRRPGFYAERSVSESELSVAGNMASSSNEITVTLLEGR